MRRVGLRCPFGDTRSQIRTPTPRSIYIAPSNDAESLRELDHISTVAPTRAADIADVGPRLLVVFLPFFLREQLRATGTSRHKRHYRTLCSCRRRSCHDPGRGSSPGFAACGTDKDTYSSGTRKGSFSFNSRLVGPPERCCSPGDGAAGWAQFWAQC